MSDEQPDYPPPAPPKLDQPNHASNGRFMPKRNQHERDAWAAERWVQDGWTHRQIAVGLDVALSTAHDSITRGLTGSRQLTEESTARSRAIHRARLDHLRDAALAVMERDHLTVSHGKVIKILDENGEEIPLLDDAPVLNAIDRLLRILESERKLDGADAPAKTEATVTITPQDAELQERLRIARERVAERERRLLEGDDEA